jgi:hypothetical protein
MDSDMEPICGAPLAAGDHRCPGRECRAALNPILIGILRVSDEQASGLLSLSLHPLSLSIDAGETGATHLGREAGEVDAQAVSHGEERITSPIGGDKQRYRMNCMRPVYITTAGTTIAPCF